MQIGSLAQVRRRPGVGQISSCALLAFFFFVTARLDTFIARCDQSPENALVECEFLPWQSHACPRFRMTH